MGGDLNEQEGELPLVPCAAPAADHGREERLILFGVAAVSFALIPDYALDGIGQERGNHAVVEPARTPGIFLGRNAEFRRLGRRFSFGKCLGGFLLVCLLNYFVVFGEFSRVEFRHLLGIIFEEDFQLQAALQSL